MMEIEVGNKIITLNVRVRDAPNPDNAVIGLNSGLAFKGTHFLFLDYDKVKPHKEFEQIIKDNGLKRGIIVESSKNNEGVRKYHALSFTPLKYDKMLRITSLSSCDKWHKSMTINNGFSTLRVTVKKDGKLEKQLKITKVIINKEGKNFYHFDGERAYRKLIGLEKESDI